jgi:2-hydroxychromene-2-carboxylate isomerase
VSESVRFWFDPTCPWAWQGALWAREVERVRDVEFRWRLFSLRLVNEAPDDPLTDPKAKSVPALRTLALAGIEAGNDAVWRLYEGIGRRVHDEDRTLSPEVIRESLNDAGLDSRLAERAMGDPETAERVRRQHREAVDDVEAFGVPTIALPSGRGIFGPVIATAPTGEEAGVLWDHVRALAEHDGFFELKRERDRRPGAA